MNELILYPTEEGRSQIRLIDSAMSRLSQRDAAYQPRVQPWERDGENGCVLKERRIVWALDVDGSERGVPSERGNRVANRPLRFALIPPISS